MSQKVLGRSKTVFETLKNEYCIYRGMRPLIARHAFAGQAEAVRDDSVNLGQRNLLSQIARQKQEDKEFFADLLTSAATKRDAKSYINRLKGPKKDSSATKAKSQQSQTKIDPTKLFGVSRAVEASPVFKQGEDIREKTFEEIETLHVAVVKISDINKISDENLHGIAQTLTQLHRLSITPCAVVEDTLPEQGTDWRQHVDQQADRLVAAIDAVSHGGARRVNDILSLTQEGRAKLSIPSLLLRPLRRGRIPVIVPVAYSESSQQATRVSANEAILALTKDFHSSIAEKRASQQADSHAPVSLDRVIVIDESGGIPSTKSIDKTHVFVNMDQEYHQLQEELRSSTDPNVSPQHASNLRMLRHALNILPPSASGLITSPAEAANLTPARQDQHVSSVGTRRQKNPLIHNLLTDKPAYSSSLPTGRLETSAASTFVKKGMPLTILPNPAAQVWTAQKQPWIKLTDPRIDLDRLAYLINDSFDRKLDVDAYLKRVNDRVAGVIIAGEYEGGAILTWETPPGVDTNDAPRLVPYLDKFAVLKKSQGAGGVADILFNAMVRTCFPNGVCWRSRKSNPVNKWYFERSKGTWKIPDMNWTMFWTTPGVVESDQTWRDYEAVCRGVVPTWADDKKIED